MMYAFTSSKRKTSLHVLTIACFVTAFVLFGISGLESMAYPLLYQLSGLVLLVQGVVLLTRYILKTYRYEITESEILDAMGNPVWDLVITETTGRRMVVVAKIALRGISAIEVIDKGQDKATAKQRIQALQGDGEDRWVVFHYINTPFVTKACYIVVAEEKSILVIPPDERMIRMLRSGMGEDFSEC